MAADVLIDDDKIAAIGTDIAVGGDVQVVDVSGKHLTPGFIDLHSHADFTLLAFPSADSALRQGITTVATGNCGGGVAPVRDPGDIPRVAFAFDPSWDVEVDWAGFGEYARRLDHSAINVAPLVAHGPIRHHVMGMENRSPTDAELDSMAGLLRESLSDGAFGLSSGLEYQPGIWSMPDEMKRLTAEVGARDRLYATHMRGRAEEHPIATSEALEVARDGGARLQLSHFAPRPHAPAQNKDRAFQLVEEAAAKGMPVAVDTFPEIWGPALLIDLFPEWSLSGSPGEVLDRLSSPEARTEIHRHMTSSPEFLARVAGYGEIYIADAPGNRDLTGLSLADLADRRGKDIGHVCCEVLVAAGEEFRSVAIRHIYASEEDLRRTLALPYCSIESDGVVTAGEAEDCPLVWNASSYGYTARVLQHYVREEAFFSLEEGVRRMTSLPAESLGLRGRGALVPGAFADIVVLALAAVEDRSTPQEPARHPAGIDMVLVNGVTVLSDGLDRGVRAGRLLTP